MLKCIYLLFDKSKMYKNSSNYMSFILLVIITVAIFILKFYNKIKFRTFINQLEKEIIKSNKNINNQKKQKNSRKMKIQMIL